MTDEEFENLKDELTWQGSEVVMMRCDLKDLTLLTLLTLFWFR